MKSFLLMITTLITLTVVTWCFIGILSSTWYWPFTMVKIHPLHLFFLSVWTISLSMFINSQKK
jgi:hypothetical protein